MVGTSMVFQALFSDIQAPMGIAPGVPLWVEFSGGSVPIAQQRLHPGSQSRAPISKGNQDRVFASRESQLPGWDCPTLLLLWSA